VVEDVEAIRGALDEPTISWLGVSYGTEIGAAYAAKYPGHVRAMVLDGAVDHTEPMRKAILEEAAATEDGLRRFVTWCSTADQCVLRGQDVLARYDVLMRGGVPAKNFGRPATADELAAGIYGYLNEPAAWPDLAKALAAADGSSPDASGLTDVMQFDKGDNGKGVYAAYRAVGCHDFPSPFTGPADMRVMGALLRGVAPHSWRYWRYSEYWDFASGCTGWPVKAQNPPGPEVITGTPPILLVGGLHDPPWRWTHTLASRIENGTLLTYTGDGHTGLYNSSCVRAQEAKYLVSGVVPDRGATCAQGPGTSPRGRSLTGSEG
jgi:pimeloyl-ACP methyl ester carboxylesterase